MARRNMQLVIYAGLFAALIVSSVQANFLPAKDGDGCFEFTGIQVNGYWHSVPGPGQPNYRVNICQSCESSQPCSAVITVAARDGDFFGDPIPDVWEQTLYYRWEVDGEVPQHYFSNYVNSFVYGRGENLLNDPKYWTYGDHTLTCYVRDPRPGEQGYLYADDPPTVWRDGIGWDKKLDITVRILEPYCSLEFVKPTSGKTLAGNSVVLFKVKTRCTILQSLSLTLRENTSVHPVEDIELSYELCPGVPEYDENTGITTTTYRAILYTAEFHNGSHTLSLKSNYTYEGETREATASVNVNIKNLAINSVEPEGVLVWKGEGNPSIPITINMIDDDFNDPVDVYVYIYPTNVDNRQGWGSPIAVRQALGVTSSSVQIQWDGRVGNTPGEGEYAEPWTYTYDVEVYQEDVNEEDFEPNDPYRVCGVSDRYRSEYLTLERTENSVEFLRYNDSGTPEDESDDFEEYYIRYYRLTDFRFPNVSRNASVGEIRVYDAALELIGKWDIANLECTVHGGCDGLEASPEGIEHGLVLPIPISLLVDRSPCIFLCHIKDDHGCDYRDHTNRWAFDLNGIRPQTLFIWLDGSDVAGSTYLRNSLIFWSDLYGFLTWITNKPCIVHMEGGSLTEGDTKNMTVGGWTTSFKELSSAQKTWQRQWAAQNLTRDIRTVVVQKSDHNTHKRLLDESETVAIATPYDGGTSKNFARSTPDKPAWIMLNPLGIENAGYDLNGNVTNDQLKWGCTNVLLHELTHVARNPSMQGHCEAGPQYRAKCVWGPELTWEFFSKMENKTIRIGPKLHCTPWHGRYEINEMRKVLGWVEYP